MAEDPSQIREAIEQTRADIAQTMEALGQKADVKARVSGEIKEKGEELKAHAAASAGQMKARLESFEQQARAALPESAFPAADMASAKARQAAGALSGGGNGPKMVLAGAAVLMMWLVMRHRHDRS